MKSGGKHKKFSLAKWFDDCGLAVKGVLLATSEPRFWVFFVPVFVIFGTLMTLLSGGTAAFSLMAATNFSGKMAIISDAMLGVVGIGRNVLDWLPVFLITVLQATLIGAIAIVWKHNKDQSNLQNSGIVAGLALLGSGCPTCGTALITPVLGAIFSGSSYLIAGVVSGAIMVAAVIVAILALRKVGLDIYVIIKAKRHKARKEKEENDKKRED